jgi:endonuclease/exonuclease/phosphatase family metal-dependent hydrolase
VSSRIRRAAQAALIVVTAAALLAPAAQAKPAKGKAPTLSVMTRNIFLGGDIAKPIPAKTVPEFETAATSLWQEVQGNDFPARAKLLANEVAQTKPDLIGLQEVALWRRGPKDGVASNATEVVYDYLGLLRKALKAKGLKYAVGSVQQEADIEGPTSLGFDMRLTMRDAILVKKRKGLKVTGYKGNNYKARLIVPTVVGQFTVLRGWTSVDASLDGRKFRFVDTHLEAFTPNERQAQARELVAPGGPTRSKKPVILVGDLNSDPEGRDGGDKIPYDDIVKAGFVDTWKQVAKGKPGFSCCFENGLMAPPPAPFDHRIDHILTKPKLKVLKARVVGNDPTNRSPKGLWPSDHGGVVTDLKLP